MLRSIIRHKWIVLVFVVVQCTLQPTKASTTSLKQEGDVCLVEVEGDLRGLCTSFQQCRSAQDLIQSGSRAVSCNPQTGNRDLVCCAERGRREISPGRLYSSNNLHTTPRNDEAFDEIETIFDVKNMYEATETGRKKHSISSPSDSTRHKNSNYSPKPINIGYVDQVVETSTRKQLARRPINEHIDLNYYEDNRQQQTSGVNHGRVPGTPSSREPYRPPNYQPNLDNYPTAATVNNNKPIHDASTHRYSPSTSPSPWQEAPRPLVEDGNGYPQTTFFRPTSTTPKPKRQKRLSEIKCKEYSEMVTKTIAGLPLTTDPKPVEISIQKCNYNAHRLIVGGENTSVGEFPHMAAVGFLDRKRRTISWSCGGTLISENFVLTAAHCATSSLGLPSVVRLGEYNLVRGDDGAHPVDYLVKEVVRHPDHRPLMRYNDIALLRLSRHVSFTTHIRPACLYTLPGFNTGKTVATGWGRMQFAEEQSDTLLKVVLSIIDNKRCNEFYKTESKTEVLSEGITPSQMCAGELTGGKDTCQGDSGGPIEITSQGNKCIHHVIGITSFGKRCGLPNAPGVYTRVSAYVPWIEQVVWPELGQNIRN